MIAQPLVVLFIFYHTFNTTYFMKLRGTRFYEKAPPVGGAFKSYLHEIM